MAVGILIARQAVHQSGSYDLELWQIINLVGAPLLAILFVGPVIEDMKAWLSSLRTEKERS